MAKVHMECVLRFNFVSILIKKRDDYTIYGLFHGLFHGFSTQVVLKRLRYFLKL
jgi:hypothetical protein